MSIERIAVGLNVELFMKHLHLFHGMAYKDPQKKKEYHKVWYQRNKENRRQQIKKYKEENREKMAALEKKWRHRNTAKINEQLNKRRQDPFVKARRVEIARKWRGNNPEKYEAQKARDRPRNRERYYQNKEQISEYQKRWYLKNREKVLDEYHAAQNQ